MRSAIRCIRGARSSRGHAVKSPVSLDLVRTCLPPFNLPPYMITLTPLHVFSFLYFKAIAYHYMLLLLLYYFIIITFSFIHGRSVDPSTSVPRQKKTIVLLNSSYKYIYIIIYNYIYFTTRIILLSLLHL